MMRMTVLASGSKGNSTLIATSRTRILVDAGLSCRELLKRLHMAGESSASLDAILITHEHQDHVQGVAVLARRLGIPVYFTERTHRAWVRWMNPRKRVSYADWLRQRQQESKTAAVAEVEVEDRVKDTDTSVLSLAAHAAPEPAPLAESLCEDEAPIEREEREDRDEADQDNASLPAVEYFAAGTRFSIGDIEILPFTIPHDAADPVGFVFAGDGVRIGLATDLGYMPANARQALKRCDVLMLESNHDTEMLRDGPYPWSVKQRVMSRVGHLSNEAAAEFLERNYDGQAAYVILAHLSESNNLPGLARICAERALSDRMSLLANKLLLAEQHQPLSALAL